MELGLTGKVALVTGASRGIGAAICAELAREGMHVCLVARDAAKLQEVSAGITNSHAVKTATHVADLRQPDAAGQAVAAAIQAFGRLDLLVNNAGATKRADFFTRAQISRLRAHDKGRMAASA